MLRILNKMPEDVFSPRLLKEVRDIKLIVFDDGDKHYDS